MTAGQKETLTKGLVPQHAGYDHTFYKTQKSACKRQKQPLNRQEQIAVSRPRISQTEIKNIDEL